MGGKDETRDGGRQVPANELKRASEARREVHTERREAGQRGRKLKNLRNEGTTEENNKRNRSGSVKHVCGEQMEIQREPSVKFLLHANAFVEAHLIVI